MAVGKNITWKIEAAGNNGWIWGRISSCWELYYRPEKFIASCNLILLPDPSNLGLAMSDLQQIFFFSEKKNHE